MQPLDLGWLVAGVGAVFAVGGALIVEAGRVASRRRERDAELRRNDADFQWWSKRNRLVEDRRRADRNRQVVADRFDNWIQEQATLTLADPAPSQAVPEPDPDAELFNEQGGILVSAKGGPGQAPGSGRGATRKLGSTGRPIG